MKLSKQQERVLEALRGPNGTTAGEIKDLYGIMDGRKVISTLIRAGFNIEKTPETGINRFGEPVRYKRYRLIDG